MIFKPDTHPHQNQFLLLILIYTRKVAFNREFSQDYL